MSRTSPSFTVADLAQRVGGEVRGSGSLSINGLETVQDAKVGHLTFVGDEHHARAWAASKATAVVVSSKLAKLTEATDERAVIVVDDADLAMIAVLELFAPADELPPIGVHASSVVDPTATLGRDVRIGPNVWIGRAARIEDGVSLHAGTRIYHEAVVGAGSVLHANVVIRERCVIGRGVILHGGVQIGTDGFGYRPAPGGKGLLKVPHLGNVILEDGVELGANTCVDRGKFGATVIGAGSKLDNLVQIGHNCRIGRCCVVSGLTGIAGSTILGDGVLIGGGVGVADHLSIGSGAKIAARSGVMNDIPAGETWAGMPAKDARRAMQEAIAVRNLPEYLKNLKHVLGPDAARLLERGPEKQATAPGSSPG